MVNTIIQPHNGPFDGLSTYPNIKGLWDFKAATKGPLFNKVTTFSCSQSFVQALCISDMQSVEDLVSAVSCPSACDLDLGSKTLAVRTPPQPYTACSFAVLKASTTGATVRSGAVVLRKDTVLLLSGKGVQFSGTRFSGTPPFTSAPSPV